MAKLTKIQRENRLKIIEDQTKPLATRKKAYTEIMDALLNPVDTFDPTTFDPSDGIPNIEVKRRARMTPPRRLPTMGMLPKKILEGQMVGMYESKQDLYLLIAWLANRVSDLEDQLNP